MRNNSKRTQNSKRGKNSEERQNWRRDTETSQDYKMARDWKMANQSRMAEDFKVAEDIKMAQEVEFTQLTARIQKLPQELRNQIEESVYTAALSGGFLHLYGGSKLYPGTTKLPPPNTSLLTVDKHVAAEYGGDQVWRENTLVIDMARLTEQALSGHPLHSIKAKLVRKVIVRFSLRDLHVEAGKPWPPEPTIEPSIYDEPDGVCDVINDAGSQRWMHEFANDAWIARGVLWKLPLWTECYAFNGRWFGRRLACQLLGWRSGDWNNFHVEVLTPNWEIGEYILNFTVRDDGDIPYLDQLSDDVMIEDETSEDECKLGAFLAMVGGMSCMSSSDRKTEGWA